MLLFTFYGVPRSGTHGTAVAVHEQNTKLTNALMAVVSYFRTIPVFICTDLNDDPTELHPLSASLSVGTLHDLGAVFAQGEPAATYLVNDIATRIDYVFCNDVGRHLVQAVEVVPLSDSPTPTSHHCPLRITLATTLAD